LRDVVDDRVRLSRLRGEQVSVLDPARDGPVVLDLADLASYVGERERAAPRWVWDDTARWLPPLLAAGVRVRRCHDLRLGRRLLERAPAASRAALEGEEAERWRSLRPAEESEPGLFSTREPTEHLRADLEDERQLAAVAGATGVGEPARLALLLAAESSGALAAAEMTHAGMPWRTDLHERLLTDLVGPRPPRGERPAGLTALLEQVRDAFDTPDLNPDSRPDLLAALRRAGLDVADTRAATLRPHDHPGIEALLRYKQLSHLAATNGWAWSDQWVSGGRFRPSYQPAGSVTGRWSSNGGGALSFPVQVRPAAVADDGWVLVVADVAQLEPRVLAGMSGDQALADAARGADLYAAVVRDGAVASREEAKLGLLGAMYGATSGGSGRLVALLGERYPQAFALLEQAARDGERGLAVRTLLGRGSPDAAAPWEDDPAPVRDLSTEAGGDLDQDDRRRRARGRFTRNFVVQGTGAEWALCWLADLRNRLWRLGDGALTERPHLVFFLHDEVVVHAPAALADDVVREVTAAAATAAGLVFRELPIDFPLTTAVVRSYADVGG
jgi:DNA polymerase-1